MRHELHRHRNVEAVCRREPGAVLLNILRNLTFYGVHGRNRKKSEENDETKNRTQKPVFAFPQGELHCFFGQTRKTEPIALDKETVQ